MAEINLVSVLICSVISAFYYLFGALKGSRKLFSAPRKRNGSKRVNPFHKVRLFSLCDARSEVYNISQGGNSYISCSVSCRVVVSEPLLRPLLVSSGDNACNLSSERHSGKKFSKASASCEFCNLYRIFENVLFFLFVISACLFKSVEHGAYEIETKRSVAENLLKSAVHKECAKLKGNNPCGVFLSDLFLEGVKTVRNLNLERGNKSDNIGALHYGNIAFASSSDASSRYVVSVIYGAFIVSETVFCPL